MPIFPLERQATAPSPGRPSPHPGTHWFIVMFLRLETRRIDQIRPPGCNLMKPKNPPPAIILKKCIPQNAAASQSPGQFRPHPANPRFIVVSLRSASGQTHGDGPLGHQLAMPSTPLKRRIFPLISVPTNRAAVPSPGRFAKH
jgi:hypothetical protein